MTSHIYQGDALAVLRTLPAESVHCVVTSPPYWGLRDYGVAGQYGLEERVDCLGWATGRPCGSCFICRLVAVFREVRRVLRADGTCWVNMGDSYAASSTSNHARGKNTRAENPPRVRPSGCLKPKDLVGQPWRLALALQADGWFLRSDIIWHKPNPMPSNVKDRPTVAHEYLFLFSRSPKYFWDHDSMQEDAAASSLSRWSQDVESQKGSTRQPGKTNGPMKAVGGPRATKRRTIRPGIDSRGGGQGGGEMQYPVYTRNRRSVWTIATNSIPQAHFATMPPALVEPCLKAGCPHGGMVLDPFFGSGTTGLVARRLGREFVGIELNPKDCRMARKRIEKDTGLLGPVGIVEASTAPCTGLVPAAQVGA